MVESKDYIKTFNGKICKAQNIIGYCHNFNHRGYISKGLVEKHDCIKRKCVYFEKKNLYYWDKQEQIKLNKQKTKKDNKTAQIKQKKTEEYIHNIFKQYNNIYITTIHIERRKIILTYIYEGTSDLTEAIEHLKKEFNRSVYLKRVKSSIENRKELIPAYKD